jgi:hypothetical protein
MTELLLTLLVAAVVLTLVALLAVWLVARHRAGVGRVDPASMNEILAAERATRPAPSIRGSQRS